MDEDDIKKLLEEHSKKYTDDWDDYKYYADNWDMGPHDPDYELMITKHNGWDVDKDNYLPSTPALEIPVYPISAATEEERAAIKTRWTGALVKFASHMPEFKKGPMDIGTRSIDPSRLNVTGAVFETEVNYQDRWTVQVLWPNGAVTSEKIDDLVIVQPLPRA